MKFNKKPILVRSFHYDVVSKDPKIKQDIQVAMRQIEFNDPADAESTGDKGNYFEIMVPFEIAPNPGYFEVSGQITQIVQLVDYFKSAQELEPAILEQLSRPLVETIETLTYQVTSVALNEGINLSFVSGEDEQAGE